eukprot:CAMPEP_0175942662 /NCGR_PEP_ID=MMETSP0108-20121206/25075_1 /TAXON_ID=195067 ORGANISM="Goniomonas pacifica, Strain CCMP1869" /NCGR_SAMPLE_ID=MMETSP0108 /ASSEMBLY_ACC=CAM_ASM_000204 /LENGTH=83 /DNA_ID=CAMNT_0017267447 /DNA_START=54 /DNA_END=302 /DNA_ORIENTATION=-
MANVYKDQGDYPRALDHHKRALTIKLEIFGEVHADVATTKYNMGLVHIKRGDKTTARSLISAAHAVRMTCLGADHPLTKKAAA